MTDIDKLAQELIGRFGDCQRVVVAFSGGVDSSVVAAAAMQADLDSCVAITAQSPSVAKWQIDLARRVAGEIGIEHRIVQTAEGQRPEYVRNDRQRCFYCKQTLYETLATVASHVVGTTIFSGTNADDLGDYRPGIQAGNLADVQTPLADLGITKDQVRGLASHFGLSNHAVPASPCLASRIAYGVAVTPERLARVELAESWLREHGFSDCRVRIHADELGRVEVPSAEVPRLLDPQLAAKMSQQMLGWGFRFVTLDLQGLRSGNLNQVLVPIGGLPG
ncbi:MAG: ATP-dependent sacrificial sulfur transferase LarE [Pirellulaceae bacterium]